MFIGHVVLHVSDDYMSAYTSLGLEMRNVSPGEGSVIKYTGKFVKVKC